MSGRKSRDKGHNFERQIARELREVGFPEARRHLEYQDGEANGVDIQGFGDIVMADILSLIGVFFGIIIVNLLVSSIKVDNERHNSGRLIPDYDQEDDLLDDL